METEDWTAYERVVRVLDSCCLPLWHVSLYSAPSRRQVLIHSLVLFVFLNLRVLSAMEIMLGLHCYYILGSPFYLKYYGLAFQNLINNYLIALEFILFFLVLNALIIYRKIYHL
ncbi:hypothetical protein H1C71_008698 [Ictidomys tridecemlineatus]|nr:hypothetical protein H1C71_008698 [Ictidomys tridecemlineatus]KAG3285106.1 hypothetical protein H1C71_008698 [Ictidomys tridecemlineatus]